MTVKELRQKLFDIEDQDAKVLVSVLNIDEAEVSNIPSAKSVIIFAPTVSIEEEEDECHSMKEWHNATEVVT